MRSLIEYMYEGLLAGQEGTIKDGDNLDNTFTKIKAFITNPKSYRKLSQGKYFLELANDISLLDPNDKLYTKKEDVQKLLSVINLPGSTEMTIKICKQIVHMSIYSGNKMDWNVCIKLHNTDYKKYIEFSYNYPAEKVTFQKLIKDHIVPACKDLESFKNYFVK